MNRPNKKGNKMEGKQFLETCEFFVMFYEDVDPTNNLITVQHLVGYQNKPSQDDIQNNIEEMVSDKDFGRGEIARSYLIAIIDKEEAFGLMEAMKDGD